jgi:hypothetical protein
VLLHARACGRNREVRAVVQRNLRGPA